MARANKFRGEVEIKLGDKSYLLVPSYGNLADIVARTGSPLLEVIQRIGSTGMQLSELAAVVSACATPELSEEDAGQAIVEAGILNALEPIGAFLVQALQGGNEGNGQAATAGKGRRSN